MSGAPSFHHIWEPGSNGRTIVLFHGTGGDENSLIRFAPALDPNASVLSMRGKSLEEGYPRFFRRLSEGVFDVDDVRFRTRELADFLRDAYTRYGVDPRRTVGFGFSNGANIAASLLLLEPDTLRATALVRPMFPIEPDSQPALRDRRALLLIGELDGICLPSQGDRLAEELHRYGAEVESIRVSAGHELTQEDLRLAAQWVAQLD